MQITLWMNDVILPAEAMKAEELNVQKKGDLNAAREYPIFYTDYRARLTVFSTALRPPMFTTAMALPVKCMVLRAERILRSPETV